MVPRAEPGLVRCSESTPRVATVAAEGSAWARGFVTLARPKSRILAWPRLVTKMLAGLMSRWTMPSAVGGIEGVGDFDGEVEEAIEFHGTASDEVLEGLPFETFHGDEGPSVFFADVVDGADVGMVESGGGFGFAAKAAERLRIFGEVVGKKFQGDEAVEAGVLSFVDDSHASAAEHLEDAVVGEGLSDE